MNWFIILWIGYVGPALVMTAYLILAAWILSDHEFRRVLMLIPLIALVWPLFLLVVLKMELEYRKERKHHRSAWFNEP